jgi:hypothetical protein
MSEITIEVGLGRGVVEVVQDHDDLDFLGGARVRRSDASSEEQGEKENG